MHGALRWAGADGDVHAGAGRPCVRAEWDLVDRRCRRAGGPAGSSGTRPGPRFPSPAPSGANGHLHGRDRAGLTRLTGAAGALGHRWDERDRHASKRLVEGPSRGDGPPRPPARAVGRVERRGGNGRVRAAPLAPIRSTVIEIAHAPRPRRDSADDEIVRRLLADPEPGAVRVVTSDRWLADRVHGAGASVEPANTFRAHLEADDDPGP